MGADYAGTPFILPASWSVKLLSAATALRPGETCRLRESSSATCSTGSATEQQSAAGPRSGSGTPAALGF